MATDGPTADAGAAGPPFNSLPLKPAIVANLASLGFTRMTPIQAQALPPLLAGRDIIARAKTGSGKTAAFGLALINRLEVLSFATQALVLCPTRELADQVSKELRRLARSTANVKILTLCGGMPLGPQMGSLAHGCHIVVGTPGRIQEHLRKGSLALSQLAVLVLDEADRMLDMGFADAIADIAGQLPSQRQTLLFSATYPEGIAAISKAYQHDPLMIAVDVSHDQQQIEQLFFEIPSQHKPEALLRLLRHYRPRSALVFCATKQSCQDLAERLVSKGFSALALHGDMEQKDRNEVLVRFANQSCPLLVATDVAARGLDVKDLEAVISFDLSRDPEVHVHRIGRTGRAGKTGLALSLCAPEDAPRALRIEELTGMKATWAELPADKPEGPAPQPAMITLSIDGGRKQKLRPGDILGALTGEAGLSAADIGKIDIFEFRAYVAVARHSARHALQKLGTGKIKGRSFKARTLG
ncbi:MAG: ATP-dependent RNA helicase DbpA [Pseudomonadales bacterium]|nr:ATP-dependent RNA helicase DbpA [Pseudomonadales bacterium]